MRTTYKKVCKGCGKEFVTERKNQDCCCRECANRIRPRRVHRYDTSLVWERVPSDQSQWQCPYRECVSCHTRDCDKCGWNPEVYKARHKAIAKKYRGVGNE